MSPAVDGGDQGGAGEAPTHPKSIGGSAIVPMRSGRKLMFVEEQVEEDSNWDGEAMEGSNVGPEAHIGGDIDSEDEARVEFEDEEEGAQAEPEGWRMFARYYSPKAMNINVIQLHFMDVWRIRGTMTFSPLKDNFFIITFSSEGDFQFVKRGGPWIHQGVACLIAPFINNIRPSATVLDSVQVWVRIYDIPWNKQTDATGRKLGSQLGKVEWVDVDTAKNEFNDFLRVRIALPLNSRLKTKITTTVKGKPGEQVYLIRYERVPHFCFHCGFIGHDKKMCEKRNRGTPSSNYDATL
jgi:hypothetical protein